MELTLTSLTARLGRRGRSAGLSIGALGFLVLSLWLLPVAASACPACADAIASQETPGGSARLVRGYARSIYLLMWTPYVLFGGAAFAIARNARRSKKV